MDKIIASNDPLEQEIAAVEATIVNDNAEVAELEGLLAQKKHGLQLLAVEVRALKRAASLRPITPAAEVRVLAPAAEVRVLAPAPIAAPEPQPGRFRNMVAQIRTSDPRLAVLPGG